MRRHLLNVVTCLSLLLLAAAVALWLRSHRHGGGGVDSAEAHRGAHRVAFSSFDGCLAVGYARAPDLAGKRAPEVRWYPDAPYSWPADGWVGAMGFRRGKCSVGRPVPVLGNLPYLGRMYASSVPAHYVQLPWWPLVLLTAAVPSIRSTGAVRRRRRARGGRCAQCGYDLRASPGRCPECGTPVNAAATNAGGTTAAPATAPAAVTAPGT